MNNPQEITSKNPIERSDSQSSLDDMDADFLEKLTEQFLLTDQSLEERSINKESVIKLLRNLLDETCLKTPVIQVPDEDTEIELNHDKQPLNLLDNHVNTEVSQTDGLPRHLIVTSINNEVFTNNQARKNFETLFRDIDSECKFCHIRIFKRSSIEFSNPIAAILARVQLDGQVFMEETLKAFLTNPIKLKKTRLFLEAPKNEKTFLISPPSSPPVGWEQVIEDPPVVNLELLATLSTKLNPLEPCELVKSRNDMPGIIIHPCADSQEFFEENKNVQRKFMPTRRPANEFN